MKKKPLVIGLVGKSCSGKNYIAEFFSTFGWEILDLDKICHGGIEENKDLILQTFGTTDRKIIGAKVFSDRRQLGILESILYPWIKNEIIKTVENTDADVVVLNGALLHRAKVDSYCRMIIYVDAPYPIRLERALKRDGITEADFEKRDASQDDVDFRDVHYDSELLIVDNSEDCEKKVCEIISKIKSLQDQDKHVSVHL